MLCHFQRSIVNFTWQVLLDLDLKPVSVNRLYDTANEAKTRSNKMIIINLKLLCMLKRDQLFKHLTRSKYENINIIIFLLGP